MELKEFVAQSLVQICEGVKQAQREINQPNTLHAGGGAAAKINPELSAFPEAHAGISVDSRPLQLVSFDVAVTVQDNTGGGAGISVLGAQIGGQLSSSTGSTSRLQFAVPVALPRH